MVRRTKISIITNQRILTWVRAVIGTNGFSKNAMQQWPHSKIRGFFQGNQTIKIVKFGNTFKPEEHLIQQKTQSIPGQLHGYALKDSKKMEDKLKE